MQRKLTLLQHLLKGVETQPNGCIYWTKNTNHKGYGQFMLYDFATKKYRNHIAHRAAYKFFNNVRLSPKEEIHHICRNKLCVNPEHLEVLSRTEHNHKHKKKPTTSCHKGHEFTPENTYIYDGHRQCLTCKSARSKIYESKRIRF